MKYFRSRNVNIKPGRDIITFRVEDEKFGDQATLTISTASLDTERDVELESECTVKDLEHHDVLGWLGLPTPEDEAFDLHKAFKQMVVLAEASPYRSDLLALLYNAEALLDPEWGYKRDQDEMVDENYPLEEYLQDTPDVDTFVRGVFENLNDEGGWGAGS